MDIIVKAAILVMQLFYALFKLLPVKKKITFISRQGNSPSLDFRLLKKEINKEHPDYEVVFLCRKLEGGFVRKLSYCFHILVQEYHIATSEALILDSYCIAASVLKHRDSLLVIQMWHSVGTMKKFGYSILDKPEGSSSRIAKLMKMHSGYTYVLCAGEGYADHLAQGFNVSRDKIKIYPLPRVELLQDEKYIGKKKREILSRYPELGERKNIVYVPTFRRAGDMGLDDAASKLAAQIDSDKFNLIIKAHPLAGYHGQVFDRKNEFMTCDEFSSMDMLFIADAVISDYSCIIYEAAVLKKPLFFYTYDYDSYMSTRDIYIDYMKEMPGPISGDPAVIAGEIEKLPDYDFDRLDKFLHKYVSVTGHETEDIVHFIFNARRD